MQETTTISTHPQQVVKTTKVIDASDSQSRKVLAEKKTIFRSYQVIWYVLSVVEVLLIFRIVLKALGANPFSGFVSFVYAITDPLALPFQGILRSSVSGGNVVEWSTIIAAAVYLLLAYGLVALLQFLKPVSQEEVEQTVDEV